MLLLVQIWIEIRIRKEAKLPDHSLQQSRTGDHVHLGTDRGRIPALQATWISCTIGVVACSPFAGRLWDGLGDAPAGHTADLVYLGAVPTSLAFCTWAFALSRMPAGRLGVTTYLVPPLTIGIAWPTLGERPPLLALAGGVIALVGVSLSRRR